MFGGCTCFLNNTYNTYETIIHISKLRFDNPYLKTQVESIFHFARYLLLFKDFTDLQLILKMKKNFAFAKKPKCYFQMLKIKSKQRKVRLKCSVDKRTILLQFFTTFSNKILLLECIFTYLQ